MNTSEKGIAIAERSNDGNDEIRASQSAAELKRSANGTILSPQPSENPKDPLVGQS